MNTLGKTHCVLALMSLSILYTPNLFSADYLQGVILAAGDIATCDNARPGRGAKKTAGLLLELIKKNPKANVIVLGDLVYKQGTRKNFESCYKPTWGKEKIKRVSYPVPGNHEYYPYVDPRDERNTKDYDIEPYKNYWKERFESFPTGSGKPEEGYYKIDYLDEDNKADWRIIGINSEVIVDDADSLGVYPNRQLLKEPDTPARAKKIEALKEKLKGVEQEYKVLASKQKSWLENEAFKDSKKCKLVFAHHPKYSSGEHGNRIQETAPLKELYESLYDNGVSVVLSGHDHHYEQFHPMDADDSRDFSRGMRSFVIGTGGTAFRPFEKIHKNSEIRNNVDLAVLRIELFTGYYTWQLIPVDGKPMNKYKEQCVPR